MTIRRTAPLLLSLVLATACSHRLPASTDAAQWAEADQLVLVTTADWDATGGELRRFERAGDGWRQVGDAAPITVGRTGTAWGIGLHADGDQRYREGFVIEHNRDGAVPNGGSCIFAHLWKAPGEATAGCTAMAPDAMAPLLAWLDARRNPVFVTLPRAQYEALKGAWRLPDIDRAEAPR